METYGDFGSKIQTLVRHLAHIKVTDTGAKSIIFSAGQIHCIVRPRYTSSFPSVSLMLLAVVEYALKENGIRALRIDQGASSIHNSGLILISSYCFSMGSSFSNICRYKSYFLISTGSVKMLD